MNEIFGPAQHTLVSQLGPCSRESVMHKLALKLVKLRKHGALLHSM